MNNERTYGIEIEVISKITRYALADKINNAFLADENLVNHHCYVGEYGHYTDSSNTNVWKVKGDSSIDTNSNYRYSAEIVSPVLKDEQGLKALKVVCSVISEVTSVNRSTGLHVHHCINRNEDLKKLMINWKKSEKYFMSVLPNSRKNNRYCRTWEYSSEISEDKTPREWWRENGFDRYRTLNLESYWLRSTVEFRLHSGTTEYEKISNWVVFTQAWVDRALIEDLSDDGDFESFVNHFKNATDNRSAFKNKRGYNEFGHRENSKVWKIDELCKSGQYSLQEIANQTVRDSFRVKFHLKNLAKKFPIEVKNNGKVSITFLNVSSNDEQVKNSADWMMSRYNHFNN